MLPEPTERLTFRRMTGADLEAMAELLGNPDVMRYYPRPKSRAEAQAWIDWNLANYANDGFGLWVLHTTSDGSFVGDCGLTWQEVDGRRVLEIGYHVLPAHQGKGYATEAARACLDLALGPIGATRVTAIVNPDNLPSRRVAEHVGMHVETTTLGRDGRPIVVYGLHRPLRSLPGT